MKVNFKIFSRTLGPCLFFCVMAAGCTPSPDLMAKRIKQSDPESVRSQIIQRLASIENDEWFSGGIDHSIVLYRLAFEYEYYDIAAKGYMRSGWFNILNFDANKLSAGLHGSNPGLSHYLLGVSYRYGVGENQENDLLAMNELISAMLEGFDIAKHDLIGLYKEYKCTSNVALLYKMGAREIESSFVSSASIVNSDEINVSNLLEVERQRQELYKQISRRSPIDQYPFDLDCSMDVALKEHVMGYELPK